MSLFTGGALLAAGLATGGGAVAAASISSNASDKAGDAASKSNAESLAFQKQQAENDYKNQETTRKANYDQYVAKQTAMNQVRQGLGLRPVEIPPYVPSLDPQFGGAPVTHTTGGVPTPDLRTPAGADLSTLATPQQQAQQYFRDQAGPQSNIAPGLSLGQIAQPGFLPTEPPPLRDAQGNVIPPVQSPFTLKYPVQT